jgi:hypothetical protein
MVVDGTLAQIRERNMVVVAMPLDKLFADIQQSVEEEEEEEVSSAEASLAEINRISCFPAYSPPSSNFYCFCMLHSK